ncbi:hypothetical protein [Amycolatopsis camponoti]|uniref:hypothetical protein n=1 Tax=Amycolatopsis camponoti TaxID=2606593 RepID=UPI0012D7F85C|nr:hypothetical protein [Amycolatopsis camponoti]
MNRTRTLAPIPPTVWTAGPNPIDPAVTWPAPIIEAITTSFSRPGDCVVLAPWPAHAAETRGLAGDGALTGARDAVRALGRNAIVEELAPTSSSVAGTAEVAEDRAESGDGARLGAMAADRANLVIASMPPERGTDGSAEVLALAAARALAFGGVLAVYTHSDWSTGRLIHPSGPMIVAAQNADLLYLQHIVTVLTPIHGGRLQPMPEPLRQVSNEAALSAQLVGSATTGHARVHGDVLVFAQAHTAIAHPEDLR